MHPEPYGLLSDPQYVFRKGKSTSDVLSYLTHIQSSSLGNFGEFFIVLVSMKAFDLVWHVSIHQLHLLFCK